MFDPAISIQITKPILGLVTTNILYLLHLSVETIVIVGT
jgi:hypothetical protein